MQPLVGKRPKSEMPQKKPLRYGIALLSVGASLIVSLSFRSVFDSSPFLLFWLAVAFSAWYGSFGPGLAAVGLSMLGAVYFFLEPEYSFRVNSVNSVVRLMLFAGGAVIICWLFRALRRTEAALRLAGSELNTILQSITDGVTAQDPTGRLIYANEAGARLSGFPSSESMLAAPIETITRNFEIRDEFGQLFPLERLPGRLALQGQEGQAAVLRVRLKGSDEERWTIVKATPVFDELDEIRLVINLFQDITDFKRTEKSLYEQREWLRVTLSSIGDGVITTDITGRLTFMNPVAVELTGWALSDAIGKHIHDVLHIINEATREEVENPLERALKDGVIVGLANHSVLIARDGTERPIDDSGAPILDMQSNIIGAVLVFRDITERRKTELSTRYLAAIVESSRDAIIGKTLNGTIVSWNHGAELIYGYSAEEAIGQSVTMLFAPGYENEFPEIMNTIAQGKSVIQRDTKRIRKDGSEIDISLTVSPIVDGFGKVIGASTIAQNITERKRIEAQEHEQRLLAEALRDTAKALNSTLNLSKVLDRILANVGQVVSYDAAEVMLVEDGKARVVRCRGYDESYLENTPPLPINGTVSLRHMTETCQPLIIPDIEAYPDWVKSQVSQDQGWRSYIGAPICFKDEVVGFLNLISFSPNFFTAGQSDWLLAFAEQAGNAINNARRYEQEQELAALQERQRLARDLHDAVSQTLFSATVVAEALSRQRNYNPDKMQEKLVELHQLTRGALAEMRALLLELRPNSLVEVQVGDLLRQLADAVRSRKRLIIEIGVDDKFDLPPDIKQVFYRIAQEALNNIAKHARATRAVINIRCEPEKIEMTIMDDGKGFDPSQVMATSMGLGIMRERAEGIGATLTVSSEIGRGTQIICSLETNKMP